MEYPIETLVVECARALLGEIIPQVRAIDVDLQNTDIYVHFFYEGELSEEELEELDTGTDEMWTRLPSEEYCIYSVMTRIDPPEPIPTKGELVYLRKE